ncbi:MAG: NRDE family protein [Bacteroidota bacterium]
MCLIFAAINYHPVYKLIVAANRDEFYARKTATANYWTDYPNVLGGRDLEAGGTWMGMNKNGKISMLTNYRDPLHIKSNAPSRGFLVAKYLEDNTAPEEYLKTIEPAKYNGFNLIMGDVDNLWYLSNYKSGITKLDNGLYGLSNHLLDTPWPKVVRGKKKLAPILGKSDVTSEELMEFLYDTEVATENLPNTGVSAELEKALSSMFIKTTNYGSRCSTVVLVDKENNVQFSERVYDLTTFNYTLSEYEFEIEKK